MIDQKTIEQLKTGHPGVALHRLSAAGAEIIVRPAARMEWKRFRAELSDDRKRLDALETLLRTCLVYPEQPAFDAMLERQPALVITFGDELAGLAGMEEKVVVEKL